MAETKSVKIKGAPTFEVVSVDPVEDVEGAVGSEGEEIVRGDGLCLARLGDHEELRQDGDRLQVDGERPQHLHHAELVVEDQGQQGRGKQQELNAERNILIHKGI